MFQGVDFEYVEVDPTKKTPEWLAISPNGQTPAILHNDKNIWESDVCLEYIGEHTHAHAHRHAHTCMHTQACTRTHRHAHAHTYITHTHTGTHTHMHTDTRTHGPHTRTAVWMQKYAMFNKMQCFPQTLPWGRAKTCLQQT